MSKKILVIFLVWLLSTCKVGLAQSAKEEIAKLEQSGQIPKLDRGDNSLGTDANANGVRDDIDTFITNNYTSSIQRAAATQTAKAMQNALIVNTADISAVKAVEREISRGIHCLFTKFDGANGTQHPARVGTELEKITFNETFAKYKKI